jgi:hypothetical protein
MADSSELFSITHLQAGLRLPCAAVEQICKSFIFYKIIFVNGIGLPDNFRVDCLLKSRAG